MAIDGHWVGYFVQEYVRRPGLKPDEIPENRFRIEAWFQSEGTVLTGKMVDLDSERVFAFSEWLLGMHEGLPMPMRIERHRYIAKYPDAVFRIIAHPNSNLQGVINHDSVNFSKSYCGPCECCIRNGNLESITRHLCPSVYYYGILSPDGSRISGTFEVQAWTESSSHVKGTGEFVLMRDESAD